jgi:hypothetical protein
MPPTFIGSDTPLLFANGTFTLLSVVKFAKGTALLYIATEAVVCVLVFSTADEAIASV